MSTNVCYWMIIEWWVLLFWRFVVPVAPVVTPRSLCEYTQNDLVTVTYHSRSFKLKWFILFSFTEDFQQISSVQQHRNCRKAVSRYYGWHLLSYVSIEISIKFKYFMSLFTLCMFYCILKTASNPNVTLWIRSWCKNLILYTWLNRFQRGSRWWGISTEFCQVSRMRCWCIGKYNWYWTFNSEMNCYQQKRILHDRDLVDCFSVHDNMLFMCHSL